MTITIISTPDRELRRSLFAMFAIVTIVVILPRRLMLVGERLSLNAHADAADVPAAQVGEIHFVRIGATKSGIRRAGNHCSFAIGSKEHYFARWTYAINIV